MIVYSWFPGDDEGTRYHPNLKAAVESLMDYLAPRWDDDEERWVVRDSATEEIKRDVVPVNKQNVLRILNGGGFVEESSVVARITVSVPIGWDPDDPNAPHRLDVDWVWGEDSKE